jgi:outer membrane protein assembly factor BamA
VRALLVAFVVLAARSAAAATDSVHTELGLVPIIGGDSDVGLTLGAAGSVARFAPDADPYAWRLEFAVVTSVQPGAAMVTHQDYHVGLVVPELLGSRVRAEGRIGFSRFGNGEYHGLGNAADAPSSRDDFGLIYPEATGAARVRVWRDLRLGVALLLRYVWPSVNDQGTLAAHLANPSPLERDLLVGTSPHGVQQLNVTADWDTRDDETSPARGDHDVLTVQLSPALGGTFDFGFYGVNAKAERFVPLAPPAWVLATRLVFDGVGGDPPFYELARARDASTAPGGGQSVRGVPAYRYFGKVKVFGNAEVRWRGPGFSVLSQSMQVGGVAFFDAGRVFADWKIDRAHDGGGLGLKVGVGGGARIYWGQTFVLRADVAWSPDAQPVAFYFNVDQAF